MHHKFQKRYILIMFVLLLLAFLTITYQGVTKRIDTTEKVVYLTFDDGPGPYTQEILNILKEEDVKATFFLLGLRAQNNNLTKQIVLDGHIVGTHSYSHPWIIFDVKTQLEKSINILENETNTTIRLFRAPYGFALPWTIITARSMDLDLIGWSCFPRDYSTTSEKIEKRVLRCIKPGKIIVLHDWQTPQTRDALVNIIKEVKNKGYSFETLS